MGFEFKKSLGQNFIKNEDVVNRIVELSGIDKDTLVIEIGPGAGSLTKKILNRCGYAILYEIDNRLENILNNNLSEFNNYKLIMADFMKEDINSELVKYEYKKIYVVANLPYYITTPIIKKIINDNINIDKMVIMIQKEVADRFSAKAGDSNYGSITVLLNYYFTIKKLFDVSKNEFIPKPKVDSSVIELTSKTNIMEVNNFDLFNKLVMDSFRFKRKTIKNNLSNYNLEIIEDVLKRHNFNLNTRSECLPLDIFVEISNRLE